MAVLLAVFLLIYNVKGENSIPVATIKTPDLASCVASIINIHYKRDITYVDINSDEDILQSIKDNVTISIVSRKAYIRLSEYNENYLIQVGSVSDFTENFVYLTKEAAWEPTAKFLIIFNDIAGDLRTIFNELLRFHVINVLVIDSKDTNMYTYNPFENYGCGKRYERIVNYGKCLQSNPENVFTKKLVTGIRNCTFSVESLHWPPYAISPQSKFSVKGIEQYLFKLLAGIEHFKVNYTFTNNAEYFSTVDDKMTVTGPLESLQNNSVDITIGGMVLKAERAAAFDILWSHIPFFDEIVILVKRARKAYTWQYIFLEFPGVIWLMLAFAFVVYAMFLVIAFGVKDRVLLVMQMFGVLLFHGIKMRNSSATRYVLMYWIWFAFLVSSFYLCSLTSLTTHPLNGFQVSTVKDLADYNLKACVSPIMQKLTLDVNKLNPKHDNLSQGCENLYQSMKTVSFTDDVYTVGLSAVYQFYKHEFCDEFSCRIYMFPQPVNKILYAIYLYKGFPLLKKLHQHIEWIRESGLINYAKDIIYISRDIKNKVNIREFKYLVLIPWHALIWGWIVSAITFVVEIYLARKISKTPNTNNCLLSSNLPTSISRCYSLN